MAQYKKQHYLPASYLRYFSEDQSKCRRDSFVWQFNGATARKVAVVSQCFKKYFYSKTDPASAERMFQQREEIYCRFVDIIRSGREPEVQNFGDLFLCMCDLNLRNATHKNSTGQEGIRAYDDRIVMFFSQLLLGKFDVGNLSEDIKQHLHDNWRMEIVPAPAGLCYLTSDHPTVFMTCDNPPQAKHPLQLLLLALDPGNVAVAFDRRFMWVTKQTATPSDVTLFNGGQVNNAMRFIYSAAPLAGDSVRFMKEAFLQKKTPFSEVTLKGWKLSLTYLPPQSHYSFIRMKPPLT